MDLRDTPEERSFRDDVRGWLRENLPKGWGTTIREPEGSAERAAFLLDWEKRLHRGGWSGIAWPREYAGGGAPRVEQTISLEEAARADAPEGMNIIGRNLTAPTLMA